MVIFRERGGSKFLKFCLRSYCGCSIMAIWDFPAKEVEIPALEQVSFISVNPFGEKAWGAVPSVLLFGKRARRNLFIGGFVLSWAHCRVFC